MLVCNVLNSNMEVIILVFYSTFPMKILMIIHTWTTIIAYVQTIQRGPELSLPLLPRLPTPQNVRCQYCWKIMKRRPAEEYIPMIKGEEISITITAIHISSSPFCMWIQYNLIKFYMNCTVSISEFAFLVILLRLSLPGVSETLEKGPVSQKIFCTTTHKLQEPLYPYYPIIPFCPVFLSKVAQYWVV